jgi:hypothetical protein
MFSPRLRRPIGEEFEVETGVIEKESEPAADKGLDNDRAPSALKVERRDHSSAA